MSQFLTIVNRTQKALEGTWDGRHYKIPPGRSQYPQIQAEKFKAQNPVMGSGSDDLDGLDYLIGIEEYNDPITPLEQSTSKELWNRASLGAAMQNVSIVDGKNGLFSRTSVSSNLPDASQHGFVPPDK